jgi:hypothetical protein
MQVTKKTLEVWSTAVHQHNDLVSPYVNGLVPLAVSILSMEPQQQEQQQLQQQQQQQNPQCCSCCCRRSRSSANHAQQQSA